MPLTKDFKATVQARVARDPKFRKELLHESVECLLAGDLKTGKALLHDYIYATISFEELSDLTQTPSKNLMPMLGPKGESPGSQPGRYDAYLQRAEGLHPDLTVKR